jgi:hypothetical protein
MRKLGNFGSLMKRRTYYQASFEPVGNRLAPLFRPSLSARSVHIFIDKSEYYGINDDKYPKAGLRSFTHVLYMA